MNIKKTDFVSDILARNKLAKDLMLVYGKIIETQPDIEGMPQIVIVLLSALEIFKSLGQPINDTDIGTSSNGSNTLEFFSNTNESRRSLEERCLKQIWNFLSFDNRIVTKTLLISFIYALLTLENTQTIESKLEILEEALKIPSYNKDFICELKELINTFRTLGKEVEENRSLTHFARKFRTSEERTEIRKLEGCTFFPVINDNSRKLDSNLRSKTRSNSQDELQINKLDSTLRHNELYEDYKRIESNAKRMKELQIVEEEKNLTFKPKINKFCENYKSDKKKLVCNKITYSSIDYMKVEIVKGRYQITIDLILSVLWMVAHLNRKSMNNLKNLMTLPQQSQ